MTSFTKLINPINSSTLTNSSNLLRRLDIHVAEVLQISRTEAQDVIRNGNIQLSGKVVLKPGLKLSESEAGQVSISGGTRVFVGQGGDKLKTALEAFSIDVAGLICLDVGASTGGFTDCLLKYGADKVYAIDNGTNQLAPELHADPRVISREQTDIREVLPEWFDESPNFATVDVSFISITKVLKPVVSILTPKATLICLIKPQFEVGRGGTNKRGIVSNVKAQNQVINEVCAFAESIGLICHGVVPVDRTDIVGKSKHKNQEYLLHCIKNFEND